MTGRGRSFAALITAAFLALASGAAGQGLELSPSQLRGTAGQAVMAGEPATALAMTEALLRRDPQDAESWAIRSRAFRDIGRTKEAREAAGFAWRYAENDGTRYAAALAMAQALSSEGKRTRAQLWLRRAVQNAPNETLRRIAVRDFRYVRSRNPWSTELSFNVAPSSNINNGSNKDTTPLFDLPLEFELSGEAQALSGTEFSLGLATRYRLRQGARHQTDLQLRLNHRTYRLSDEAREQAPDAEGSDYAFTYSAISLVSRALPGQARAPIEGGITLGRTWYGRDPYMQFVQLGLQKSFPLGKRVRAYVGGLREWQSGFGDRDDADNWRLTAGLATALGNGDRVSLGLSLLESGSDDPDLDFTRYGVEARYLMRRPVLDTRLEFGLGAFRKEHDSSRYSTDGRNETELNTRVTAVFQTLTYYGFVPTLTLSASRTDSNIGLYDVEELGLRMAIRSAF